MDDVPINPGEVIDGKYEIISNLGQGGMGVVYKARALSLNRDVAIKMLTHVDADTVKRFSSEAKNLAKIKHPAVVRIDDIGSSDKWGPYLVLAYIAGRDLSTVAKTGLPIEEAVTLALAICSGVSACHIRSIIHRDLKPSNIRVTNETSWLERVKIFGFGLALPFDSPILKAYQTRISQFGAVEGVSRYIAPELLRRENPTDRCDQYSIAALLYLLLTGRAPFEDLEGDNLIRAVLHGGYITPHVLRPGIPARLEAAVVRGLHLDPIQRFANVNELALTLIPFGPPNLKSKGTRYFTNANGPIDRRLIEPVSAFRQREEAVPDSPSFAPLAIKPLTDFPRYRKPTPLTPPVPPARPAPPTPLVASHPPSNHQKSHHHSRWLDSNAVVLFASGSAFGAALATALFVAFFIYCQRHLEPCFPNLSQPPSEVTVTPGSHATK
jgi:serine/threonine-protein kinase